MRMGSHSFNPDVIYPSPQANAQDSTRTTPSLKLTKLALSFRAMELIFISQDHIQI